MGYPVEFVGGPLDGQVNEAPFVDASMEFADAIRFPYRYDGLHMHYMVYVRTGRITKRGLIVYEIDHETLPGR